MSPELDRAYRKVLWRILPLLGLCYLAAYLDRVNVGFAKLSMGRDLGLSDSAYGLGAGIFFFGYFLFEVPSNLVLHRIGARVWLARIMASWAAVSAGMAALGPLHQWLGPDAARQAFIGMRFLLGAAEAGFFPGVLLYLTYWFPPSRRSFVVGLFIIAQPVAFVVGAPMSGLILATCQGLAGLAAWQWLYLLEAAPAVVLSVILLARLDNGIADARWLDARERGLLEAALLEEPTTGGAADLKGLAMTGGVWRLAGAYFLLVLGAYGLNFWAPSIVRSAGASGDIAAGLLTAAPYGVGVAVMLLVCGRSRDARRARHGAAWMCALAGAGLALSAASGAHLALTMSGLTLGVAGYLTANALFWRLPGDAAEGRALAAGLAAVNAVGNLGGFAGPYLMGVLAARFSDPKPGLLGLALALAAAGLILAGFGRPGPRLGLGSGSAVANPNV